MGGCSQKQGFRIGDKGPEIGHSAYSDKYEAGVQTCLDTDVKYIKQSSVAYDVTVAVIKFASGIHKLIPKLCVVHRVVRCERSEICQQHTESDSDKQKGLKLFLDSKPKKK